MSTMPFVVGTRIRVKPEFDIPPIFRGGKPSEGIIDHIDGATLVVVVDGKSVPYQASEVEAVKDSA